MRKVLIHETLSLEQACELKQTVAFDAAPEQIALYYLCCDETTVPLYTLQADVTHGNSRTLVFSCDACKQHQAVVTIVK